MKSVVLEHLNTDQNGTTLRPLEAVEAGPNAILHVTARYNGESKEITDIPKYRKFYRGILLCSLRKVESNEKLQNQLKVTAPDMTMKIHLECDDWNKTLEYRFFADDSVLLNGIYVGKLTDGHLNDLIDAAGLMLSPNPNDTIVFWE